MGGFMGVLRHMKSAIHKCGKRVESAAQVQLLEIQSPGIGILRPMWDFFQWKYSSKCCWWAQSIAPGLSLGSMGKHYFCWCSVHNSFKVWLHTLLIRLLYSYDGVGPQDIKFVDLTLWSATRKGLENYCGMWMRNQSIFEKNGRILAVGRELLLFVVALPKLQWRKEKFCNLGRGDQNVFFSFCVQVWSVLTQFL